MFFTALAAALLSSCSPSAGTPDPYNGAIDSTALDAKFQPTPDFTGKVCPSGVTSCYPAQQGWLNGSPFYFYNFGVVKSSTLQSSPTLAIAASLVTATVYTFPDGCQAGPGFDPQADAYRRDLQFPVFSALPLTASSLPLVNVVPVGGATTETCNDLKMATSVTAGAFGASVGPGASVSMWPVVDNTAPLVARSNLVAVEQLAWYKGLLLQSVNGGSVPLDGQGNLLGMDGVILDPPAPTGNPPIFAKPTDPKVIILPYGPGDPRYSPVVRLWDYTYDINQPLGTLTAICHGNTQPCAPNEVDIDKLISNAGGKVESSGNTLFIVASPQ